MRPAALAPFLALALAACSEQEAPLRGIETRLLVDRTQARVGDRIGVTLEIDTPPGFRVERPDAPPPSAAFVTDEIDRLDAIELQGGQRHRILWTLRARDVGDLSLPTLQLPLVHPDGRIEPLPLGGLPLQVVSVQAEMPEREVFFDIREPPPARPTRGLPYVALGIGAILAGVVGAAVWRRHYGVIGAPPDPRALASRALELLDPPTSGDPRAVAAHVSHTLWGFVRDRWPSVEPGALPGELPEEVDADLAAILRDTESCRFERDPDRARGVDAVARARAHLEDVVRG